MIDTKKLLELGSQTIADLTIDAIVIVSKTGNMIYVNKTLCSWLGYTEDELIGKNIALAGIMPADSVKKALQSLVKRFLGQEIPPYNLEFIRKDKSILTSIIKAKLIRDENNRVVADLVVITEISEKKELEEALAKERQKTDIYIDLVGMIIVVINKDGTVALLNKKGSEILKIDAKDAIGKNWFETFIPESDRERVKKVFAKIISGDLTGVEILENKIVSTDGTERLVLWHNTFLKDESGNIYASLASGEDITESAKFKQELIDKTTELERINNLMVGRELKMMELKRENEKLKKGGDTKK